MDINSSILVTGTIKLLNDLIKVCAKVFLKYKIIENDKICYLDKIVNSRRDCPFDKITGIEDSIIVINDRKLRINYNDELDSLNRIINQFKNKVFIFEDTNYCEGETDGELGSVPQLQSEQACLSQHFTHHTHESDGKCEADSHKQTVKSRFANGVVGCETFRTSQNDAVYHNQRQEHAQTVVQIGQECFHSHADNGNKSCNNYDEAGNTYSVGNDVAQQ